MGKYTKFESRQAQPRPWDVHPIWRGIGCIMMLIVPVLSYAGAVLLYEQNLTAKWVRVPRDLTQTVSIPGVGAVPHLFANLIVTVLLMLLGYAVFIVLYAVIFRLVGPPRYGPVDSPPVRR
jgi:hypothetical protein